VSKTKRKEVLIGARGCVMHTGLSELFGENGVFSAVVNGGVEDSVMGSGLP